MSTPIYEKSKLLAIRESSVMDDICRIFREVESEYHIGKEHLLEARALLYSNPKKCFKLMKKARKAFIEESKAAGVYNRYRTIITQLDDSEVTELDRRYREQLRSGSFKKAHETAIALSRCRAVLDSRHSISVRRDPSSSGSLGFIIVNSSRDDIDIRRAAVYSEGRQLASDTIYPFTIHRNSQVGVSFNSDGSVGKSARFQLEYTEKGLAKIIVFDIDLTEAE